MPYTIRKGRGKRPYRIINRQTGKVVGTSVSMAKAKASIGYRMGAEEKKTKLTSFRDVARSRKNKRA